MIQEFRVDKYRLLFDLQPEEFTSDHNLLWYAQNRQCPEAEVIHVMLRALKPGDCAIDAGANVGFFSVLMSKLVGEHGRVVAVEPDSRNLRKLQKNLDINSCKNVEIWPYALAQEPGTSFLRRDADNGKTALFGDGEEGEKAYLDTLDNLRSRLPKQPVLLKLDIEGSEVGALLGACDYDIPCIVSEVNDEALKRAGHSARDLFTLMRERGYRRYQIHKDGSMPSHIVAFQTVKLTRENVNILFAQRDLVTKELWPEVVI